MNTKEEISITFTPTQWSTADDKARFARQFIKFISSDFDRRQFPRWFYTRLRMTFGHIAHYNEAGFYATFFTSLEGKVRFLQITLNDYAGQGDPAFTYSDVEKYLKAQVLAGGYLETYKARLANVTEEHERTLLRALKIKYEKGPLKIEAT